MYRPIKFPFIYRFLHHDFIYAIKNNENKVFLTFDDGPSSVSTEKILNILAIHNIKATFFCSGENVEKFPDLFKKISNYGHTIGNHGYHHLNGWKTTHSTYIKNVLRSEELTASKLFRPPYGKITCRQAGTLKDIGFEIVMWNLMSWDFDVQLTDNEIIEKVLSKAKSGSIIVFHDNHKTNGAIENILNGVINGLKIKGYNFDKINL